MGLMQESDPRFAHLERNVGLFLLGALLVLAAAVGVAGVRQGLFTPKSRIHFLDESGSDLVEGMEVRTRGFRVGKIERLNLTDEGKVDATLAIERRNLRWIRRDSKARIARALIGDNRIEISPGSQGAPPIADGDTIVLEREPDLTEVAKKVMEEVKPVLYSVKSLVEYLADPKGDVKRTLANLNGLTAGLVETRGELDRTVREAGGTLTSLAGRLDAIAASLQTDLLPRVNGLVAQGDRAVADAGGAARSIDALVKEDLARLVASLRGELLPQVSGLVAKADSAVAGAGRGVTQIEKDLPALLGKVNASLENLRVITENLVPASGQAGAVIEEGRAVIEDAGALVNRTRGMWPFREEPKGPERIIDVDSYRRGGPAPGAGAPAPAGRDAR